MKSHNYKIAVFALIVANLIWGAASPIFKWSMESISPFTLGYLRFFFAALFLFPFAYKNLSIMKKDFFLLFLIGFFSVPVHIGLYFMGLQYAPSINAPIIASSAPIFLIMFSIVFLKEKPRMKVLLGTLLSLIGVAVIIFRPILEHGFDTAILGNVFFFLSMLSGIVHLLLLKKIMHRYSSTTITFWTFVIGTLFFASLMILEMDSSTFVFDVNIQSLTGIIFGAIFSSGIAWLLLAFGIKYIPANEVGIFVYIDPIVTALVAIPLLGETITTSYIVGSSIVFFGIFIAENRLHFHPIHRLYHGFKSII